MNKQTEFNAMVNKLAKKGDDILTSLTPEKCHLWHMVTGVVGEVNEACAAIALCDEKNLHEELGDLQFYIRGLVKDIDGVEYNQLPTCDATFNTAPIHKFIKASDGILDSVKKHVIYDKELDVEKLQASLNLMNLVIAYFYDMYDFFHDDILEGNLNKLLKGKNARYAEGEYSDKQAQSRADKKGEK